MPAVARVGDIAGGAIVNGAINVLAGGLPVAQLGSVVSPHGKPPHSAGIIISSSVTVLAQGIPIARLGDVASCGHTIASGAINVISG
jgi:uncharacterized Zn-binding protein involved in type VI secretion